MAKRRKKLGRFRLQHSTGFPSNNSLTLSHADHDFLFAIGTKAFLRKLTAMGDVWNVTVSQGLEWIKNPTTLDKIEEFKPWKCDTPAPPPCPASQCKECYYADRQRLMSTCAPACPSYYPWVGHMPENDLRGQGGGGGRICTRLYV